MRRAHCHPDRRHCARGLCKHCYQVQWRRERKRAEWGRLRRRCALCVEVFTPARVKGLYCSPDCQCLAAEFRRAEARHPGREERVATRDPQHARRIALAARDRGCRRVPPNRSGRSVSGPYYAAWHRGGGLYVIRVRWPRGAGRLKP